MKRTDWKRMSWIAGACLSLLLIGGLAVEANAQQPPAPAAPAETSPPAPDPGPTQPAPPGESSGQPQPAPSTNTQIETRTEQTERVVEREPGKFLGVDPTVAMIVGAVIVIVIVVGLVALGRRGDEIRHTHGRRQV